MIKRGAEGSNLQVLLCLMSAASKLPDQITQKSPGQHCPNLSKQLQIQS
ncbi:unnamed protein product [Brassica oleracea var. botrytis]